MALIKCKSCGHTVSDKALKCPKCGAPVQKEEEAASRPVQEVRQQVNQTQQPVQNPPSAQETPSAQPKQDVQNPPKKRVFVSASGDVYSYDEEPEKGNANVAVWILVAVFAVAILSVGAYFLFFSNGDTKEHASDTPKETYAGTRQEEEAEEEEEQPLVEVSAGLTFRTFTQSRTESGSVIQVRLSNEQIVSNLENLGFEMEGSRMGKVYDIYGEVEYYYPIDTYVKTVNERTTLVTIDEAYTEIIFPDESDVAKFIQTVKESKMKATEDGFTDNEDVYWNGTDVSIDGAIVTLQYRSEP